ncbi:hypothetical protein Bbelb_128270 [Branchiostoma belcheri]|nr:hypothetical protein Bbelb_128270 [Branchiostoma belcheri]
METLGDHVTYQGSRAEWILKRANDFDDKARSFACGGWRWLATWVCLDPACITYNQSMALCLCDDCDHRFHPVSSPVMCRHRRLAVVLYISLLMLYRYRKIAEAFTSQKYEGQQGHPPMEGEDMTKAKLTPEDNLKPKKEPDSPPPQ